MSYFVIIKSIFRPTLIVEIKGVHTIITKYIFDKYTVPYHEYAIPQVAAPIQNVNKDKWGQMC